VRVLAGIWAGKDLQSPSGRVRPTREDLRHIWMDMLASHLDGAKVLDLFAGSGAVGIEALSRGARSCDFVENAPSALHALKANVASLRARDKARIFKRDAIQFVERIDRIGYDIALADPPYGSRKLDRIFARWRKVPFSSILAVEHDPAVEFPIRGKRRRVGDSAVTVFHG
jgi:16S rRNA (guanine966-N2)-methyltransferase